MNHHAPQPGPIRTLFLAPKLGLGGMTRYLVELSAAMSAMGHPIRVVTVDGPGIARFRAEIERDGAAVEIVPNLTRRAMMGVIRAHKAEAVKLFTGAFPPDTRLSLRLAGAGIPIVESIHVLPTRREVSLAQKAFYAARPKPRYAMVVFTEEVEEEVRRRIPSLGARVMRLRYGMRIPEPGLTPHAESEFRFITVCRLDEAQKDVETLLRAFALVREGWDRNGVRRPRLTIVGEGNDRTRLTRLAGELNLRNRVAFTGWVEDPIARLRESDVFVLSTRRESPGRVNIEASAVGLPVIASRVEGCTESVAEGVSGSLVEPGDARALADEMLRLAPNEGARATLAQGGRDHASKFDIGAHAALVSELIAGVCARG
jgi:glycosyltransferase involved in cell wall biosynthesis